MTPSLDYVVQYDIYDDVMRLGPDRKGAIAEASVVAHATRLGIGVYRPVFEGGRFDLVLDVAGALLRAQVKWASRSGGAIVVRCYSSRRAPEGMRVRRYTSAEVDLIVAYYAELDRCYVLPPTLFEGRRMVHLRIAPTGNNQRARVNWADDHRLEDLQCTVPGP